MRNEPQRRPTQRAVDNWDLPRLLGLVLSFVGFRVLFPQPPLGCIFTDMKSHPDYRSQNILRANAFQKKEQLSEEELNERMKFVSYTMHGPIYHAHTDICVMGEDGQLVAGCEALINARCLEADIERVCTHSHFRRRGFARAVIQECLYRLKAMGLYNAYITGYGREAINLYGSLGAVDEVESFYYEVPA
jgi:GNAT superfamily N-acetyltransferase